MVSPLAKRVVPLGYCVLPGNIGFFYNCRCLVHNKWILDNITRLFGSVITLVSAVLMQIQAKQTRDIVLQALRVDFCFKKYNCGCYVERSQIL